MTDKEYEKKIKRSSTVSLISKILIYIELIVVAIIVLYPVFWIIGASFNPTSSIASPKIIPEGASLKNYKELFQKTNYVKWYGNTLYIAVLTSIFAVIFNTMTAFVFARFKFKGQKFGLLAIMVLQMFPSFLGMTALYMIALTFGMLNNLNMLVIVYVAGGIPGSIWLVKGYMLNLPRSLDEAAYIDGASKLQIFFKVILPLCVPIIAFMAVTSFMAPWLDYMLPRFLINKNESTTLAVGLFDMISGGNNKYTLFAAGAILIGVPIASLYMYFQKYLLEGLTAGANKGE